MGGKILIVRSAKRTCVKMECDVDAPGNHKPSYLVKIITMVIVPKKATWFFSERLNNCDSNISYLQSFVQVDF